MSRTSRTSRSADRGARRVVGFAGLAALVLGGLTAPAYAAVPTSVDDWPGLVAAFGADGTVQLVEDIDDAGAGALAVPVGGEVTLDLAGHSLTIDGSAMGKAGIGVPAGASLTITDSATGTNTLHVTGGEADDFGGGAGAGIGGDDGDDGGEVTIDGGNVDATGGAGGIDSMGGAGIGGGGSGDGGVVTITGGTVTATGGDSGAGIGGGTSGAGGTITITGGIVTATGGIWSAGIGGGTFGGGGVVTIAGGTVAATGGQRSAGIGGGMVGAGGTITITGGTVAATGADGGAGIGGGGPQSVTGGSGGETTIDGGTVTATGTGGGAGIGGGLAGAGDDVTINAGAVVTATGGTGGSAVGAGEGSVDTGTFTNAGTLILPVGASLLVSPGKTITNTVTGTIENHGVISGTSGTVDNRGSIDNTGGGTIDHDGQGDPTVTGHNYTLSFDLDGVSGTPPVDQHVYAGTLIAAGQSLPAGPDDLAGWYDAAAGGTRITDGTDLSQLLPTGPSSTTLYAHWSQRIVFTSTAPADPQVGDTYTVAATGGGSGQPVSFTVTGPACSLAGRTVTFDHAGTCKITAHQAGAGAYVSATATQTITVAPLDPSIAANIRAAKPRGQRHGWYRSRAVRVSYTCRPGSAPVTDCPKARTYRANGSHRIRTTIHGSDGGTATIALTLRIDHKKPTLRVRNVRKHRTYAHQPRITCRVKDKHSGVRKIGKKQRSCTVGRHRIKHRHGVWRYRVVARDNAGNKTVKTGTYRIRGKRH